MMRSLVAILTCLTYSAATWGSPWLPPVRDGVWLQNGIHQQQRWNAHEILSDKNINDATLVTSYVCAVVDFEKELVQRAAQLSEALQEGKKKKHLDPRMLEGMTQAVPILVPLMKSGFTTEGPSCDKAMVIVRDYLAEYPEMLDKTPKRSLRKLCWLTTSRVNFSGGESRLRARRHRAWRA